MKKGIYELLVLLILNQEDMYGYEITKTINKYQHVALAGGSSIYPILKRLSSNNYLETYWKFEEGRNRKYYKITRLGVDALTSRIETFKGFISVIDDFNL